jgi:peptidase M1-like protein/type IX secretion system substrate protein
MRFRYGLFVLACLITLPMHFTALAQGLENDSYKQHMEAHGKSAMDRAFALSKGSQFTIESAKNYDVIHYDLNTTIVKNVLSFNGRVEMTIRSLIDGMDLVEYNFGNDGNVDSIYVNGAPAQFTKTGDVVSVTIDEPFDTDEIATITTVYSHPYNRSALLVEGVNNVKKAVSTVSIASQSEPYSARKWWPCKDDPDDKADSIDITITTDTDLFPVSNGLMQTDIDNADETHTVHWKSNYPIVTYLVSVAISDFNYDDYSWKYNNDSMQVGSWYFSLNATTATNNNNTMLNALTVFSDLFGTYPFIDEKYGMAEYTWGGAMEHQTVSSMGAYFTDIVTHELAHQWFGDKVTCGTFEHIWLNEGWATYSEALYREFTGNVNLRNRMMRDASYFGPGTIFVHNPETTGGNLIFSGNLSYNKASWVLHMLRGVVGDSAFFAATKNYLGEVNDLDRYRSVRTPEFQQFQEDASGIDLQFFFDEWIQGEFYPTYSYGWESIPEGNGVKTTLEIEQLYIPQRQLFTMPIQIYFKFSNSDTTITIWNDTELASYVFNFDEEPEQILLDRDNWILKRIVLDPKPLVNEDYDKTILLVNGIDWDVSAYSNQVKAAYMDSVFTATRPYQFYDLFPYPVVGYPANIKDVSGSIELPLSELQKYCTVVWAGNAYNGDELIWQNSPMLEYVQRGGNVILISRLGDEFLDPIFRQYLGITWTGSGQVFVRNCTAQKPGLVSMPFIGDQNLVATFSTNVTSSYSELIFTDETTFDDPEGIGVWSKPQPTEYGTSGHFVFLSMRGYRVDRTTLEQNMSFMLDSMLCFDPTAIEELPSVEGLALSPLYPNPVSKKSTGIVNLEFSLNAAIHQYTTLRIYDQLGRLVSEPLNASLAPGNHTTSVDISALPAGVYLYRLSSNGQSISRKMTIVK